MPPKPTKQDLILDGAIAEFLEQGYSAASMDRIASTAGVSKATVYSHFQSKENLFIALIERLVKRKFLIALEPGRIQEVIDLPPAPFLRGLALRVIQQPVDDPEMTSFLRTVIGESGRFPSLAKAFVTTMTNTALQSITFYFKMCPHLEVADPEATARIFMGAIAHFVMVQHVLHGNEVIPMEQSRFVDTLVDLVTRSANETSSGARPGV